MQKPKHIDHLSPARTHKHKIPPSGLLLFHSLPLNLSMYLFLFLPHFISSAWGCSVKLSQSFLSGCNYRGPVHGAEINWFVSFRSCSFSDSSLSLLTVISFISPLCTCFLLHSILLKCMCFQNYCVAHVFLPLLPKSSLNRCNYLFHTVHQSDTSEHHQTPPWLTSDLIMAHFGRKWTFPLWVMITTSKAPVMRWLVLGLSKC